MIKVWIKGSRQLSLGWVFFSTPFFFFSLKKNPRRQNAAQVIWGRGYFYMSFWNSGKQHLYQQRINLHSFFLKESTRVGLWPIKVEEQTVGFSLCDSVCMRACMRVCIVRPLLYCHLFFAKQSEFLNPWSGKISVMWLDLSDSCSTLMTVCCRSYHHMFFCILYLSVSILHLFTSVCCNFYPPNPILLACWLLLRAC